MEKWKNINILYEDNHLIVVHKPANLATCPDDSKDNNLFDIIKEYIKIKYQKPGNVYLGLVHRLDRPTEGIIVFAKTSKSAKRLSEQLQNNKFEKIYYAIVENKINDKGHLEDYLLKDNKKNTSIITNKDKGKLAILDYEVIKRKENLNLIKIKLTTGRSHQIRVQFSSRNNPLYGDHKYNKNIKKDDKSNLALISKSLTFYHPITKEKLTYEINIPNIYPWNIF